MRYITEIPGHQTAQEFARGLMAEGYRRVSRKSCHLARIDRPDWKERLEEMNAFIGADQWRRVHSKDLLTVPSEVSELIGPDSNYPNYRPPGAYGVDQA